jgi:hypothetical protein
MIELIAILSSAVLGTAALVYFLVYDAVDAPKWADESDFYADEGDLQNFSIRAIEDEFWRDIA